VKRRVAWFVSLSCLLAVSAFAKVPPEEAYQLHCSGCHGPDGSGRVDFVPSLRGLVELLESPGGRAYLARVPGVAQAPLESAALAELLNWVLRELSDARDFAPYAAHELETWRQDPLRDPAAARSALGQGPERAYPLRCESRR
jgi:mono/diheme cytochrome c family protein